MPKMPQVMRAGVDTGGTFTDLVLFDGPELRTLKVFSTRQDPARGILEGLGRLFSRPPREGASLEVIHGTTVATNTLLERSGAPVALVTTQGFEDILEIGRQARPRLYDLKVRRDPPLVPKGRRFGITERTDANGKILARPSLAALRRLKDKILRSGAESIALCFLFSFANSANEKRVAHFLQTMALPVSVSHEILPEFREYERLSTVVVNAYLVPLMKRYLAELDQKLRPRRVSSAAFLRGYRSSRLYVMQSSGGMAGFGRIAAEPVRTILSGPAGGVAAAHWLAELLGLRQVISFDMGGTSTDVCLLDGRPRLTRETVLGGLPIAVPVLDIHSVGAGGGSLARIDAGGALRVGPESAGAEPGPVCYGRGGDQPTVTDANLILGRLDASHFLGGAYQLNEGSAAECFNRFLRQNARLPSHPSRPYSNIFKLGEAVVSVANATMERALRLVSVERGHDPREFTMVSFGGAGGLHAADLARSLGIRKVVIPQNPGAFSALGVLLSDMIRDVSLSVLAPVPPAPDGAKSSGFRQLLLELDRRFQQLERAGRGTLSREGRDSQAARAERRLDVRYAGQGYELTVPMSARFPEDFHEAHLKAHGHSQPGHALEIVSLRVRLIIRTPKPRARAQHPAKSDSTSAVIARKLVWFGGQSIRSQVYGRRLLRAGMRIRGPAIVTEYSSTTVIPADYECRVDPFLNMVLVRHAD